MNFHRDSKSDVGHKLQFRARMKTVQLKDTKIYLIFTTFYGPEVGPERLTLGTLPLIS